MAEARTVTSELSVGGMDCVSCASTVEAALKQLDGVEDVRVDVVGGRVRVAYAEAKVGADMGASLVVVANGPRSLRA